MGQSIDRELAANYFTNQLMVSVMFLSNICWFLASSVCCRCSLSFMTVNEASLCSFGQKTQLEDVSLDSGK